MPHTQAHSRRLVIVDADDDTRVAAFAAAAELGARVDETTGGSEALAASLSSEESALKIVIVNLAERRVTAAEVVLAIKSLAPSVPVLAVGTTDDASRIVRVVKAGASDFLGKPLDGRTFLRAVRDATVPEAEPPSQDGETSHLEQSQIESLETVERAHVLRVLESCLGNLSEAARLLGIGRTTLYRKLERYGVHPTTDLIRGREP